MVPEKFIVAAKRCVITWKLTKLTRHVTGIRLCLFQETIQRMLHLLRPYLDRLHVLWWKGLKSGVSSAVLCINSLEGWKKTIRNLCIHLRNNCLSKSKSVKRLEETPLCSVGGGILFNEALTDGLCLKSHPRAHPDTDRTHSDNLYHSMTSHTGKRWR